MRLRQWFEDFRSDATFALQQMQAHPATIVAAMTALGIGANSAISLL
jgi:hypothetical protein